MSTRWQPQPGAPGPGSSGRVGPGVPGQGPTTGGVGGSSSGGPVNPEVQAIIKLVRTDPDFRNELKSVIAEALQADMGKLKSELMGQMSGNNAAAASSHVPPPMDYLSIIQRDFPGASLEEWSHNDEAGSVYGFAETVTSHIIKQNNMTYLCDIKESVDLSDVVFLIKIGKLFKQINPQSALACVLICRYISPRAKALADKCKMKTIMAP